MSLMAGSVAVLAFPEAADAAIVHVTGSPLSLQAGIAGTSVIDWDIDGVGGTDFIFFRSFGFIFLDTYDTFNSVSLNGRGMVQLATRTNYDAVDNLPLGVVVGPTLATAYAFGPSQQTFRTIMSSNGGVGGDFPSGVDGDNFIGFAFETASTVFYGWAKLVLDNATNTTTISEWAYENTGAPIEVGDTGAVNPPATTPEGDTVPALLLLGMGAAGIRTWRKRKQAKLTEDSQEI